MKRRGRRISPVGCLVVIALCGVIMLAVPKSPRPLVQERINVTDVKRASEEPTSPPAPLLEERGESTLTPLEADVTGLAGIESVNMVYMQNGIVSLELDVAQGYVHRAFAEALLEVARRHATVNEFNTILNDGVSVPVDFMWRAGEWHETRLEQIATLLAATAAGR